MSSLGSRRHGSAVAIVNRVATRLSIRQALESSLSGARKRIYFDRVRVGPRKRAGTLQCTSYSSSSRAPTRVFRARDLSRTHFVFILGALSCSKPRAPSPLSYLPWASCADSRQTHRTRATTGGGMVSRGVRATMARTAAFSRKDVLAACVAGGWTAGDGSTWYAGDPRARAPSEVFAPRWALTVSRQASVSLRSRLSWRASKETDTRSSRPRSRCRGGILRPAAARASARVL